MCIIINSKLTNGENWPSEKKATKQGIVLNAKIVDVGGDVVAAASATATAVVDFDNNNEQILTTPIVLAQSIVSNIVCVLVCLRGLV